MTGNEFLQFAQKLFETGDSGEALSRTVISRAYYGVYHLAVDYLRIIGFPSSGHGKPPEWLRASGVHSARKAGELLAELATARNNADYDLAQSRVIARVRDKNFVNDLLEQASEVKSLLLACGAEPTRSDVKAGIDAYRQRTGR